MSAEILATVLLPNDYIPHHLQYAKLDQGWGY